MKRLITLLVLVSGVVLASPLWATPLRIAHVNAPRVNCIFNARCVLTVNDTAGTIAIPFASGTGRLQTRTAQADARGVPAAGDYAYVYRVDLTQVGAVGGKVCVHSLKLDFGAIEPLDYNRDGRPDDVYVVTGGGLGSVAPSSADQTGGTVRFEFKPAVCPGNRVGGGETSFFFGMASKGAPHPDTASVGLSNGDTVNVGVRVPTASMRPPPPPPPHRVATCDLGVPGGPLQLDPSTPICLCVADSILRNDTHCGFFLPGMRGLLEIPRVVTPGQPFPVNWSVWLTRDLAKGARVRLVTAKGVRIVHRTSGGSGHGAFAPGQGGVWMVADGGGGLRHAALRISAPGMRHPMQVDIALRIGGRQ